MWRWDLFIEAIPVALQGLAITLEATFGGSLIALTLGLAWALLRMAPSPWLRLPTALIVDFIRSTPLLVQLFLIYYGLAPLLPWEPSALVTGILGLGLHYSTYCSEVYRAAILGVPHGQHEAARALGLASAQSYRSIILPQALPRALPALGNYIIAMFKETPLLSTITILEMMGFARQFSSNHYSSMEVFTLVALIFLLLSLGSSTLIRLLEQKMPVRHA